MLFHRTVLVLAAALISPFAGAQSSAPVDSSTGIHPSFAVISIKPTKPGVVGSSSDFSNDRFVATNSTLKSILQYDAYEIPGPQILGIPATLSDAAFDIEAKIDPAVYAQMKTLPREQFDLQRKQMVQQLLADRFKLAVRSETRPFPIYALVVAKGGPKLKDAKDPGRGPSRSARTGQLSAQSVTTADLASSLTRILQGELGRIVLDETGLTGRYDLVLKWTPESGPPPMLNGEPDASAPSIFTAIQEQLGLKLQATKGDVPVLVVDHAEMPSEN